IENFTGIIFDQQYEHEGNCYLDNDKIFLRSELIYYEPNLEYNSEAAKLFNISCYLTKQSIFNKEINHYSNDLFNQAVKFRYHLSPSLIHIPLFHKQYNNIDYITN